MDDLATVEYIHLFIHSIMQQYLPGAYVVLGIQIQQRPQGHVVPVSWSTQSGGKLKAWRSKCRIQPREGL